MDNKRDDVSREPVGDGTAPNNHQDGQPTATTPGAAPNSTNVNDEKLHGDRWGRKSLDTRPRAVNFDESDSPGPMTEKERAFSAPHLSHDKEPVPPAPVHAPTNIQSSRQNAVRSSAEFDRRFDGPFGRQSLAMARRRSSIREDVGNEQEQGTAGAEATADRPLGATNHGVSTPQVLEPEPPPLNYTLKTKKRIRAIIIFWFFIILDSVIIPIALYFGLWYGVGPGANTPTEKKEILSANAVFSIVTAAVGGASILEYIVRFWRLWKKGSTCRVIGARRWYLDLFHWNYSLAWIIIMLELIVGTCQYWPPIRLLSMPVTTMLFAFGTELLVVDCLRIFRIPAPIRMSSIPKGAQLRPCIYTIIEDVVAVDGGGGTAYREALNRRYEASHVFRTMLRRLGVFWALGAEITAVVCTILIFTLHDDTSYVIGWSVPFVWAGVWAMATIWYVKKELKREKVAWAEEMSKNTA